MRILNTLLGYFFLYLLLSNKYDKTSVIYVHSTCISDRLLYIIMSVVAYNAMCDFKRYYHLVFGICTGEQ